MQAFSSQFVDYFLLKSTLIYALRSAYPEAENTVNGD